MCNHCSSDPRDALGEVEEALCGLRVLVNKLPIGEEVGASGLGAILGLLHDRLRPASDALQDYIPRP
jgi:hypothetical protein